MTEEAAEEPKPSNTRRRIRFRRPIRPWVQEAISWPMAGSRIRSCPSIIPSPSPAEWPVLTASRAACCGQHPVAFCLDLEFSCSRRTGGGERTGRAGSAWRGAPAEPAEEPLQNRGAFRSAHAAGNLYDVVESAVA